MTCMTISFRRFILRAAVARLSSRATSGKRTCAASASGKVNGTTEASGRISAQWLDLTVTALGVWIRVVGEVHA
jgi:hypothetical protein